MDIDALTGKMIAAGKALGGDIWSAMQGYAEPELHKIAVQIAAIGDHLADYTPDGAKALMDMQIKASIGVIVAMTSLVLLAVQQAINAILDAVRAFVNDAVHLPLL